MLLSIIINIGFKITLKNFENGFKTHLWTIFIQIEKKMNILLQFSYN